MLQHRSFVLAALASIAVTAAPAFASPARGVDKPAPVAMSGARQPDREVPVVEHTQPAPRDPAAAAIVAPGRAPRAIKAGFAQLPASEDATAGFGVRISDDARGGRFGFATAPRVDQARFGFATVVDQRR